ncbi:MAG: hypothetical protein ACRD22_00250 [Terriglobia bacterium]
MEDPWHFPRSEFATHYFSAIADGPTNRSILSAPRRKGKTQFLLRDLAPLARERGHKVVYASLRHMPAAPQRVLIDALEKAEKRDGSCRLLEEALYGSRLRSHLGVTAERGLPRRVAKASSEELAKLGSLIRSQARTTVKRSRPLLLIIDDVQHLAARREFWPLTASLRTALDVLGRTIIVVYAGSAPEAIARIFWRRSAPFYASAHEMPLPDLGGPYIEHIAHTFHQVSGRRLDRDEAAATFAALGRNPGHTMIWLNYRLLYPRMSSEEACHLAKDRVTIEYGFEVVRARLDALDHVILRAVIEKQALFAKDTTKRIAEEAGIPAPPTKIQARVAALMRAGVLMPGMARGEYVFQDGVFRDWLLAEERCL